MNFGVDNAERKVFGWLRLDFWLSFNIGTIDMLLLLLDALLCCLGPLPIFCCPVCLLVAPEILVLLGLLDLLLDILNIDLRGLLPDLFRLLLDHPLGQLLLLLPEPVLVLDIGLHVLGVEHRHVLVVCVLREDLLLHRGFRLGLPRLLAFLGLGMLVGFRCCLFPHC